MNKLKTARAVLQQRSAAFTLVEIMIVVLIIGILLAIAVPNFMQARESGRARACIGNLKQIDSATQQDMMDKRLATFTASPATWTSTTTSATSSGLVPTYIRSVPIEPEGGTYTIGNGSTIPTCSIGNTYGINHSLT